MLYLYENCRMTLLLRAILGETTAIGLTSRCTMQTQSWARGQDLFRQALQLSFLEKHCKYSIANQNLKHSAAPTMIGAMENSVT